MKKQSFIKFIAILAASIFTLGAAAQEYATIYVYRKKKLALTGVSFKIYINKLEIAQIPNGGRLEYHYYKSGKVNLMCGVFTEYGGTDKYDEMMLEIEKGKSYYLKGDGKSLVQVSEELGKLEFGQNEEYKGGIIVNDDKPWGAVTSAEEPKKEVAADGPEIILTSPKLGEGDFKTGAGTLKVSGYASSKVNIKSVKVNTELLTSDELGNFSKLLKLKDGMNRVHITITDVNGKATDKTFNVLKEEEETAAVATNNSGNNNNNGGDAHKSEEVTYRGSDPFKGTNVSNVAKELKAGKFYALFIGIDNYGGTWPPLKNAVNDAKALEALCKSDYRFDVVKALYNSEATRSNIMDQLDWLVANVKENDNVLIFYSGHGELKKELNKGYWVPQDAKTNSTSQFISNSEIQTFLGGIPSKHTLLISDACFSGDIFRGNTASAPFENSDKYYINTYNLKSRQAISSGGLEPVMDGGKDGHSVFTYYMLQALKGNSGKYFDATQLFNKIKIPVVNNSDQTPSFNPIKNTADEGGNFIFIRK
jgi:hypothetical protein